MATRSEKLRRRQRRKEKKRQHGTNFGSPNFGSPFAGRFLVNPRGQVKMSEVLLDLVHPEWDQVDGNDEAMHKLLTLGMAGWNAALMEGDKRAAFLEDLAQTLPSDLRGDFKHHVEMFIRRKEERFPHIHRPIFSFELTYLDSGEPHLVVLSGLQRSSS